MEEALNNGLPVVVSNKVDCAEEIVAGSKNGLSSILISQTRAKTIEGTGY